MKKDWTYVINPFISLAKRSRTKAIEAANYTNEQLKSRQADTFFDDLFTFFDPLNTAMQDEEAALEAQIAAQKGSTATVDDLLETLSSDKIELWDINIQTVYRKGTPQYIAILPNGRKPFQSGKKDDRITTVKALSTALTGISALSATKSDVDTFYTAINNARSAQTGKKGDTGSDSDALTDTVIAGMEGLYYVLTTCLAKYYTAPKTVEPLFALNLIRNSEQEVFMRTWSAGYEFIAKRTLLGTDKIRFKVISGMPVRFFIAEEKNDTDPKTFKDVQGEEEEVFTVADLGNVPVAKYIKAQNLDGSAEAKIEMELL